MLGGHMWHPARDSRVGYANFVAAHETVEGRAHDMARDLEDLMKQTREGCGLPAALDPTHPPC